MTPQRPPTASNAAARGRACASAPSSSLTAIRRAWNVFVATWVRRLEGEPAAGLLDLRGRDAEIQQDGLGDADLVGAGNTVEVAEVAPPEDGPGAEASQPGPRPRQRLGIAVDPQKPHLVWR